MEIDPGLFREDAISDETKTFNAQLQALLSSLPKTSSATPDEIRAERRSGQSFWGPVVHSDHARNIVIEGPGGALELRIIEVGTPRGVYLHIHGGGWVLGGADLSDVANEAMALATGCAVVSVDYRLAPEHPYPAGIEDCIAGAVWLIAHAEETFGTDVLTIGGESAGANLAAATLLGVRDRVGYSGWRGANLVYGSYLPGGTPSVHHWDQDGLVLDSDTMMWFRDHYSPQEEPGIDDPLYAPLYGRLDALPPALFSVGTRDPLLDDTLFMAMRWLAAGNDAELAIYPGGIHGFDAFPIEIGIAARQRMHAFIAEAAS